MVLNDLSTIAVEHGALAELGDFYSGESRRILVTIDVPRWQLLVYSKSRPDPDLRRTRRT